MTADCLVAVKKQSIMNLPQSRVCGNLLSNELLSQSYTLANPSVHESLSKVRE